MKLIDCGEIIRKMFSVICEIAAEELHNFYLEETRYNMFNGRLEKTYLFKKEKRIT
jgi:hypothetical protein